MKLIVDVAKELLDFHGAGQLSIANAATQPPHIFFVMGAHEARTTLAAARLYTQWHREIPVVISGGGNGCGSWFLQQAVASICLLKARPALGALERSCEATLLERLLVDEGVPQAMISLECKARYSEENWRNSLRFFRSLLSEFGLPPNAVIGVVQSPLNRLRAQHTGVEVLQKSADPKLAKVQVKTIEFPRPHLDELSERERLVELFRLFGLPNIPKSELRACKDHCPSVIDAMSEDLKRRAETAERDFHALLETSPGYLDHVRGALETMAPELGGIGPAKA